MAMNIIKEYEAKLDSKHRLTIRGSDYKYFQVKEYGDGHLELLPKVLVDPGEISINTLKTMDQSVESFNKGEVSEAIELDSINEES
jgi:hypothetical protein